MFMILFVGFDSTFGLVTLLELQIILATWGSIWFVICLGQNYSWLDYERQLVAWHGIMACYN